MTDNTKPCPHCDGTGRVLDERAIGALMRSVRESKQLSLRKLALRLKWSATYVSDLERGHKLWTTAKQNRYLRALNGR